MASAGDRRGGGALRELSYGDSGNTATDGRDGRALAYEYDQADRLVAVSDGGVEIARYVHNALGQRVAKDANGGVVHYVYDTAGRLIAEHDGATGAVIAEYVWLAGAPLAYVRGGATYWVHGDHLGTPQLLTDGAFAPSPPPVAGPAIAPDRRRRGRPAPWAAHRGCEYPRRGPRSATGADVRCAPRPVAIPLRGLALDLTAPVARRPALRG